MPLTNSLVKYSNDWWERRRLRYNIGLIVSGLLAFVCIVIGVDRGIEAGTTPEAEITLFTTAFQAVTYLFMMAVANVCYLAGPISESIVRPKNLDLYRRVMFQVGFWLSVLLPFSIPGLIFWDLMHPSPQPARMGFLT